jgi:hypothetical protein
MGLTTPCRWSSVRIATARWVPTRDASPASIFTRAALQIGAGITVGLIGFLGVFRLTGGSVRELLPSLVLVAGIMTTVGLLRSTSYAQDAAPRSSWALIVERNSWYRIGLAM